MKILLDTQVLLWAAVDDPRLSPAARNAIETAERVYVSAASIWEIAIKSSLGKLAIDPVRVAGAMAEMGFEDLPVTTDHAARTASLPWLHRDPFDRLLIAQALLEPLRLFTADQQLLAYSPDLVTLC